MMEAIPWLVQGLATTLIVTLTAFAMGAVLGLPLALARRSKFLPLSFLATAYIEIARGIPPIAWVLLLFFGLQRHISFSPLTAGILALGLIAAAYLAENYRSGIEAVNQGQWEAAQSVGLNPRDTFFRIIAPQGISVALPPSTNYLVGLFKDSAVVSVIGVTDIAFQALTYTQQGNPGLPVFAAAAGVYLLIGIPLAIIARKSDQIVRAKLAV